LVCDPIISSEVISGKALRGISLIPNRLVEWRKLLREKLYIFHLVPLGSVKTEWARPVLKCGDINRKQNGLDHTWTVLKYGNIN
jgi:hypothetical protein